MTPSLIPKLTAVKRGRINAEGWDGAFAEVFGEDDALTIVVAKRLNVHDELVTALEKISKTIHTIVLDGTGKHSPQCAPCIANVALAEEKS